MSNIKNKRKGEKTACTKAANELDTELNKTSPDRYNIESLVTLIEKKLTKIENYTDLIIDNLTDEDEIVSEKTNELDYESKINLILTGAKVYLKGVQNCSSVLSSNRDVKLPKLSLNKFDDTILGCPAFLDSFYNSVDKRLVVFPKVYLSERSFTG